MDAIILGWVLEAQASEHACSLWQRDCFSAVFSDTATKKMALAQQISCLIAAKCTSMLQITDSDFSKQLKSLLRRELQEIRTEFQQQTKGIIRAHVERPAWLQCPDVPRNSHTTLRHPGRTRTNNPHPCTLSPNTCIDTESSRNQEPLPMEPLQDPCKSLRS